MTEFCKYKKKEGFLRWYTKPTCKKLAEQGKKYCKEHLCRKCSNKKSFWYSFSFGCREADIVSNECSRCNLVIQETDQDDQNESQDAPEDLLNLLNYNDYSLVGSLEEEVDNSSVINTNKHSTKRKTDEREETRGKRIKIGINKENIISFSNSSYLWGTDSERFITEWLVKKVFLNSVEKREKVIELTITPNERYVILDIGGDKTKKIPLYVMGTRLENNYWMGNRLEGTFSLEWLGFSNIKELNLKGNNIRHLVKPSSLKILKIEDNESEVEITAEIEQQMRRLESTNLTS